MHLHGSMSEGAASCLAHDHMAAVTGHAEVLWWTDHDFRVSNFGKLRRATLVGLLEQIDHPNRNPEAAERTAKVQLEWTLVEGEGQGYAEASTAARFGAGGAAL